MADQSKLVSCDKACEKRKRNAMDELIKRMAELQINGPFSTSKTNNCGIVSPTPGSEEAKKHVPKKLKRLAEEVETEMNSEIREGTSWFKLSKSQSEGA